MSRVDVRHRQAAHAEDEGRWKPHGRPGDGLQTVGCSPVTLALRQRTPPGRARSGWGDLRGWIHYRARRPAVRCVIVAIRSSTLTWVEGHHWPDILDADRTVPYGGMHAVAHLVCSRTAARHFCS